MTRDPADLLVIVGATGDLAGRLLMPSLLSLESDKLLPDGLEILCAAIDDLDTRSFREQMAERLARHASDLSRSDTDQQRLLRRVSYRAVDLAEPSSLDGLTSEIGERRKGDVLVHLSTAPSWYAQVCQALGRAGLNDAGVRLMLEKPIGHDLDSARDLNDCVAGVFRESQVYRVDHYLGKDGVQNLLALRFGNALFEPVWNARHIEQVQITVAETLGVEDRANYYDRYGAMRDMVQNHLLQLLTLVAMEPPSRFEPTAVRNEKYKVLRSLRSLSGSELAVNSVAGQYSAGAIDGRAVDGYVDELGKDSRTETFAALRVHIDNWRWSGVPFYLRTGKRMPQRMTEIHIQFKAVPHAIFPAVRNGQHANALVIRLQPEEHISLGLMNKVPGLDRDGVRLARVALDLDLQDAFQKPRHRIAYERLYLDALEANGTLFVRYDEIEAAWAWVDEIVGGWIENDLRPRSYPAGTWGPSSAIALAERHGHSWFASGEHQ